MQQQLAGKRQARREGDPGRTPSLLLGLVYGEPGERYTPRTPARIPSRDATDLISSEMCSRTHDLGPAAVSVANWTALAALDRASLQQLWRELWERPAPPQASRSLLLYGLAYRMQERAYGGLSAASRRRLRNIAQKLASPPGQPTPTGLTPGTRLIRQWRAQRYEVSVLKSGFAYRGSRYASLSAIARLISGTHCSGPRFFGLKPWSTSQPRPADGR